MRGLSISLARELMAFGFGHLQPPLDVIWAMALHEPRFALRPGRGIAHLHRTRSAVPELWS